MEIKEKAQKYLSEHADVPKVYSTTDGFLFLRIDHAKAHAQSLESKEVETHQRGQKEEQKPFNTLDGNVAQVQKSITMIDDTELLEALILEEESNANRKGVLEAIAKRIENLKTTD